MFTSRRSTRLTVGRVLAALSRCSMTDNDEHEKEGAALLSADCFDAQYAPRARPFPVHLNAQRTSPGQCRSGAASESSLAGTAMPC